MNYVSLTNEDLTMVGGPMHMAHSSTRWTKHFTSVEKAKAYANKDYAKNQLTEPPALNWVDEGDGRLRTADLGWVMYYIRPLRIEE